jgi:hypothetical protein
VTILWSDARKFGIIVSSVFLPGNGDASAFATDFLGSFKRAS